MPIAALPALVETGFYGHALALLAEASRYRNLTTSEKVLQLELTDLTSSFESVHERATQLLVEREVSLEDRVRCLIVAGTSLMRHGKEDQGNSQFRRALSAAAKGSDQIAAF